MNMIIFIIFPFIIMIMTLWSSRFVKELWRRRQKLWFRWQLTELSKVRLGALWGMGHFSILGCLVRFVKMGNNSRFWDNVIILWQIGEHFMISDLWKWNFEIPTAVKGGAWLSQGWKRFCSENDNFLQIWSKWFWSSSSPQWLWSAWYALQNVFGMERSSVMVS